MEHSFNAGFLGEYTRTEQLCDGVPVYLKLDSWYGPPIRKDGSETKYPAYMFRRNYFCDLLPSIMQQIAHCNTGADNPAQVVWQVVHQDPADAQMGSIFDCDVVAHANLANLISTTGDCAHDPGSTGCDGHWRECQESSHCHILQKCGEVPALAANSSLCQLPDEAIEASCPFPGGHEHDVLSEVDVCPHWRTNPGLLMASGREKDMAISLIEELQKWYWLALADGGNRTLIDPVQN
jgi:hypothetical protein